MSELSKDQNNQVRDLERAVLGGLMLETERFDNVRTIISHLDFEGPDHQFIFESMGELVNSNKPLDPLTVSDRLDSKNLLNKAGGKNYLIDLASTTPSSANLESYAESIREQSIKRKLLKANSDIRDLIINPDGKDASSLLDEAEAKIFALNDEASRTSDSIQSIDQLIKTSMDNLQKGSNDDSVLTGYTDLDKITQGLHRNDLVILAASPSMGKTSLAMNIVENVLLNEKIDGGILFFSLEMAAEALTTRLLSSHARVSSPNIRSVNLSKDDLKKFTSSAAKLKNLPLYIDDSSFLSPMELRARARRISRMEEKGLALIVVDYIQLMEISGSSDNRANQVSEISRSLKSLAKELNVPVLALSQLNREVSKRDDKRPRMSDLRDSGSLEQDADLIVFIHREPDPSSNQQFSDLTEIIISKQRNGPTGKINLTFMGKYTRFEDYAVSSYADSFNQ
tara:strand:+ start:42126 stop:43487 length:1362 start_codon:yes stop_codon:yes gene_type:complete